MNGISPASWLSHANKEYIFIPALFRKYFYLIRIIFFYRFKDFFNRIFNFRIGTYVTQNLFGVFIILTSPVNLIFLTSNLVICGILYRKHEYLGEN